MIVAIAPCITVADGGSAMEEIGTFGPTSVYAGRVISFAAGRLTIAGVGEIPAPDLAVMDGRGEVIWRDDSVRAWLYQQVQAASSVTPGPASRGSSGRIALIIGVVAGVGALVLGAVLGLGLLIDVRPEPPTPGIGPTPQPPVQYSQVCEITCLTAHDPSGSFNGYVATWVVKTVDGGEVTSSGYFEITDMEYSESTVYETPSRAQEVQALAQWLTQQGWQPVGQGPYWYSMQFAR